MDAPQTSQKTSDSSSQTGRSLARIPPAMRLWIALVIVIAASLLTLFQSPAPDPFRPPPAIDSIRWWFYPLEWNASARLQKIGVNLNSIQVVPGTNDVWAAGNQGMVIVSSDSGLTWEQVGIRSWQVAPATSLESDQGQPTPITLSRPSAQGTPFPTAGPTSTPTPTPISSLSVENESLIALHFADADHGLAVSDTGTTFETWSRGGGWAWDEHVLIPLRTQDPHYEKEWQSLQITLQTKYREFAGVVPWGDIDSSFELFTLEIVDNARPTAVHFLNTQTAWVLGWYYGAPGHVWRTQDGGKYWDHWVMNEPVLMQKGLYFSDQSRGWVVGGYGGIRATTDSGVTWKPQASGTLTQLNAITFLPDGQHGWIVGDSGLILSTNDGGATWVHRTQGAESVSGRYLRFPAPWYFIVLLIVGLTLLRRAREPLSEPEESVADVLISDRPVDTPLGDVLSFNSIALGLSRFLRNENTKPPLTIAIMGEWGTGKSSLMKLLQLDLLSYKFRPVWFNAWHHQKEEHMLASLLENVKLQAVPRLLSFPGLLFRGHLLWIRRKRQLLPALLLLFVFYVLGLYYWNQSRAGLSGGELLNNLAKLFSQPLAAAPGLVKWLPLLAGMVAFLGAIWRAMTAFGVKPASLLAGISGGASIRGLEAQTSFRQKFSIEFNDATRALGKRFLLIFIDDLDRCRPENVLETLEAVNFLTSSGECFVIIGMAREYVERCVGRAFKDIAEEMIDDLHDVPEAKGADRGPEDQAKEKRVEFARQYLDKLINIEVPVPTAKQPQSLSLLLAGASQLQKVEAKTLWQEVKKFSVSATSRYWKFLFGILMVVVLFYLGSYLGKTWLPDFVSRNAPTATPSPSPTPSPSQSPTPMPTPRFSGVRSTPVPTSTPSATPSPTPASGERAKIALGGGDPVSRYLVPFIALFALGWFGVTILTRRPGLVVKDSPNFVEALKIWHALVFSRQSTPRSIKRFMNRVRFLAMRQRPTKAEVRPSLLKKLFSWRTRVKDQEHAGLTAAPEAASEPERIPDEALVALAALRQFSPQIFFALPQSFLVHPLTLHVIDPLTWNMPSDIKVETEWKLFVDAQEAHRIRFGDFDVMKYRERFLEMVSEVKVR
jgi:photosystem II stability/assembly factor-like uncharacterized protein